MNQLAPLSRQIGTSSPLARAFRTFVECFEFGPADMHPHLVRWHFTQRMVERLDMAADQRQIFGIAAPITA